MGVVLYIPVSSAVATCVDILVLSFLYRGGGRSVSPPMVGGIA